MWRLGEYSPVSSRKKIKKPQLRKILMPDLKKKNS